MINKRIVKNILDIEEELEKGEPNFREILMAAKDSIHYVQDENIKKLILTIEFCAENIYALPSKDSKRNEFITKLVEAKNKIKGEIVNQLLKNES